VKVQTKPLLKGQRHVQVFTGSDQFCHRDAQRMGASAPARHVAIHRVTGNSRPLFREYQTAAQKLWLVCRAIQRDDARRRTVCGEARRTALPISGESRRQKKRLETLAVQKIRGGVSGATGRLACAPPLPVHPRFFSCVFCVFLWPNSCIAPGSWLLARITLFPRSRRVVKRTSGGKEERGGPVHRPYPDRDVRRNSCRTLCARPTRITRRVQHLKGACNMQQIQSMARGCRRGFRVSGFRGQAGTGPVPSTVTCSTLSRHRGGPS
jgi:hypothetical protein